MIYLEGSLCCVRRKESGKFVSKKGGKYHILWVGRKPVYQPKNRTDRLTGPADGNSRADSRK